MSIVFGDLFFAGGRHQNITLLGEKIVDVLFGVGLRAGKALDGAVLDFVCFEFFGVDAVRVYDGAVVLEHAYAFSALATQVAHRVETHVAETLCFDKQLR